LIDFDWIDYRGGALAELGAPEEEELLKTVVESNCIILCIDARNLIEPIVKSDGTANAKVLLKLNTSSNIPFDRINTFLNRIEQKNRSLKSDTPIVIMITKYDLLMRSDNTRSSEEIIKDIKCLFKPLFKANSQWSVFICPFTLGPSIIVNREDIVWKIVEGDIDPLNTEHPIAFAIYSYLQKEMSNSNKQILNNTNSRDKEIATLNEKRRKLEAEKSKLESFDNKNFFQKLFSDEGNKLEREIKEILQEINTLTSKSENALNEINKARFEREKIKNKLKQVASIIEGLDVFVNGVQQKIKVE
jgi:hypothetical protein